MGNMNFKEKYRVHSILVTTYAALSLFFGFGIILLIRLERRFLSRYRRNNENVYDIKTQKKIFRNSVLYFKSVFRVLFICYSISDALVQIYCKYIILLFNLK